MQHNIQHPILIKIHFIVLNSTHVPLIHCYRDKTSLIYKVTMYCISNLYLQICFYFICMTRFPLLHFIIINSMNIYILIRDQYDDDDANLASSRSRSCKMELRNRCWNTTMQSPLTTTTTYYNHFTGLWILSGSTRVSRYRKGKTNLDFTEARDSERQWHQLGHIQICTSLQTDNHTSTPPLSFYRPDALSTAQPTASKHCFKYRIYHVRGSWW